MQRRVCTSLLVMWMWTFVAYAQSTTTTAFPFHESFDTTRIPLLPAGWTTSKIRIASGDFSTTTSTPLSAPATAIATDARVIQWLCSPVLSMEGRRGITIEFFERRSSTFTAGLIVECAVNNDTAAWSRVSDTLWLVNSSTYMKRTVALPQFVENQPGVRLRWRTLGNGTGATGTLRIDDITIAVEHACDLSLELADADPLRVKGGETLSCRFTLCNRAHAGTYIWRLVLEDSTLGRTVADAPGTASLALEDSIALTLDYPSVTPGLHIMHCRLICAEDEDSTNNAVRFSIMAGSLPHSIAINEIMYDPSPGQTEYLEFVNASGASCDLIGWSVATSPATQKNRTLIALASRSHILAPGAFVVVASDSILLETMERAGALHPDLIVVSSLGLNNTGDDVILYDASGSIIDSLRYSPAWHTSKGSNTGRSLERIHPSLLSSDARSWSSSVALDGGTPGAPNSIFTPSVPTDASMMLSPNPFSPDGDGIDDFLGISYALQATALTLRVRIFDCTGRLVRTLANNDPSAARGMLVWNGRDDAGTRVRMGIYVILLEALDVRGAVLRTMKGAAVVATRLR